MIHYLYAGHFVRENNFIKFECVDERKPAWYLPVVQKPLNQSIIDELLHAKHLSDFPEDWGMGITESGYIEWDSLCGVRDASEFIAELSDRTQCDLADYSTQSFTTPEYLRNRTHRKG